MKETRCKAMYKDSEMFDSYSFFFSLGKILDFPSICHHQLAQGWYGAYVNEIS